jgi:A/G-specific adenine glycosylase
MTFAAKLIAWQRRHGRRDLPWHGARDPYRIWLSEIMLQQTQVSTVIPYYRRFLARFPDVQALAAAREEEVLALWSGLGYYARGRNLHAAARRIVAGGGFPQTQETLMQLPGIGRSTAAAIAAFAYGERAAILDGNVKRVLARCFGVEGDKLQWPLAARLMPARGIETYTQALMDLGATLCVRSQPRCGECPVRRDCFARKEDRVDQLPAPRQRKAVPLRHATWHVVRHGGEVLLERRAGEGLWAGLWTFPEAKPKFIRTKGVGLARFEHAFTHFRLSVRALLYDASRKAPHGGWIAIEDALAGAIPTPVRKVLKALPAASR